MEVGQYSMELRLHFEKIVWRCHSDNLRQDVNSQIQRDLFTRGFAAIGLINPFLHLLMDRELVMRI